MTLRGQADRAQRDADFEAASRLMYGEIPALERELAEATAQARQRGRGGRPPAASTPRPAPWSRKRSARTTSPTWSRPGPASRPGACSRARPASCSDGGRAGQADRRPGPGRAGRLRRRPPVPGGHRRSRPPVRLVPVPRADRRRQDRAGQGAGRLPLRRRARDEPDRHERVLRAAFGRPAGRRAARLRRVRGRRPAHRGGPAAAVLRGAARRGREGAPGSLRHPAAGAR